MSEINSESNQDLNKENIQNFHRFWSCYRSRIFENEWQKLTWLLVFAGKLSLIVSQIDFNEAAEAADKNLNERMKFKN